MLARLNLKIGLGDDEKEVNEKEFPDVQITAPVAV